ncbi:MAG: hypothetical protein PHI35_05635 [Victivallaceae bacterium]|nr:hypothetical protein [Victivallaceae bacterium]
MIDLHCHILPGIDDGARDLADTLDMLEAARHDAIKVIVCTSHFSPDADSAYDEAFDEVQELARRDGIKVCSGMEYDSAAFGEVNFSRVRRLAGTDYILVDFRSNTSPEAVRLAVYKLNVHGLQPVAAHPERLFYDDLPRMVKLLDKLGVKLQINARSITGGYGRRTRKAAFWLLMHGACHLVANDAHRKDGFRMCEARHLLSLFFPDEYVRLVFDENPAALVAGQPLNSFRTAPTLRQRIGVWFFTRFGKCSKRHKKEA